MGEWGDGGGYDREEEEGEADREEGRDEEVKEEAEWGGRFCMEEEVRRGEEGDAGVEGEGIAGEGEEEVALLVVPGHGDYGMEGAFGEKGCELG